MCQSLRALRYRKCRQTFSIPDLYQFINYHHHFMIEWALTANFDIFLAKFDTWSLFSPLQSSTRRHRHNKSNDVSRAIAAAQTGHVGNSIRKLICINRLLNMNQMWHSSTASIRQASTVDCTHWLRMCVCVLCASELSCALEFLHKLSCY